MSFDSKGSEIYYIAEVGTEDQHHITLNWFIYRQPSRQWKIDSQIPGCTCGCWQRTPTSSEGQDS